MAPGFDSGGVSYGKDYSYDLGCVAARPGIDASIADRFGRNPLTRGQPGHFLP
jgi:hypothetical protein